MLTKKDKKQLSKPSRVTVAAYLGLWLDSVAKRRVRTRTLTDYKNIVSRYVEPSPLGRMRLDRVQTLDVEKLYTDMLDRDLSPRTVRYVHSVLHSAFKKAVRDRKLTANPCDAVDDLPKIVRKEKQVMNAEQRRLFLPVPSRTGTNRCGCCCSRQA